jgi:hypothetical protein
MCVLSFQNTDVIETDIATNASEFISKIFIEDYDREDFFPREYLFGHVVHYQASEYPVWNSGKKYINTNHPILNFITNFEDN